jgi:hypothetical protein
VSINPKLNLKVSFAKRSVGADYMISPIAKNIPNISEISKLDWSPSFTPRDGFARTLKYFGVD